MNRPSLRRMLLLPLLFSITLGLGALAIYLERSLQRDLVDGVDVELRRVTQSQLQPAPLTPGASPRDLPQAASDGPSATPSALPESAIDLTDAEPPVILVVEPDGTLVDSVSGSNPFDDRQLSQIANGGGGNLTIDTPSYRVMVTEQPNGTVLVAALTLDDVEATIDSLRTYLAIGGVVLLGVEALVIWASASYVTASVRGIAEAARRVADGDLETTIDIEHGSSETLALAGDIDTMLNRLRDTISTSEAATAEAVKARTDMRRFLADASHELRTPLTAVRGYSDLYAGGMLADSESLDRAMGRIGSESERMTRLVNDMLQLTRSGDVGDLVTSDVDMAALAEDIVSDVRAAYPECEITLVPSGGPHLVRGDAGQLHQAILNVVANANEHGGESPIEIVVGGDEESITVSVVDHGPGIDADHLESIFLPFFRADRSRTKKGHVDAGLGLAVTRRILDGHGGSIGVHGTVGGGATFVLTLPRSD